MTQTRMLVDSFKWRNKKFRFNEELIQNYDGHSDKGYIFEVDVKYPKKLHCTNYTVICFSYPKE